METNNLKLEPCTPADALDFIALERDDDVMLYLNGGAVDHDTVDPAKASFLMPRGTEPYVWTARKKGSGDFVGWFCLYPETEQTAELGYRLRRSEWGRGFASEGAQALIEWGFRENAFGKIVACTMAVNIGSRRVMEKVGMHHVRTDFPVFEEPIPGAEHGEVWYEITRADLR